MTPAESFNPVFSQTCQLDIWSKTAYSFIMMINIRKKRVLIVDDDDDIREPFARIIKSWDLHAYTAKNGKEAIDMANKKNPDIVLLDIDLPDISGFEVCKIIKSGSSTKNIPVIMLSAMGKGSIVDEGFQCGADAYIIKDVDFALLKTKVFKLLGPADE